MSHNRIDFEDEVKQLLGNPLIGADHGLWVLGGELEAAPGVEMGRVLSEFLGAWDLSTMPYRIWQHADRIRFGKDDLNDPELFERGRLFGASPRRGQHRLPESGGDLNLRRDGARLFWHYVGTTAPADKTLVEKENDYWQDNPEARFRFRDEAALLWGTYDEAEKQWRDARVGWAELYYPFDGTRADERLDLHYSILSNAGQPAFVWWREVTRHG